MELQIGWPCPSPLCSSKLVKGESDYHCPRCGIHVYDEADYRSKIRSVYDYIEKRQKEAFDTIKLCS